MKNIFEREWVYQVEHGRIVNRKAFRNFLKKADFPTEHVSGVVSALFNGDRFPELAGKDKCLFLQAMVIPKIDGSIDSLYVKMALVPKDSSQYEFCGQWKWIENDFSNPCVQEFKTCLELIPGWDYLFVRDKVRPIVVGGLVATWEGKGCKVYYEDKHVRGLPIQDMLTWNDTTYFFPGQPLQYDMNLYARLRSFLKDDFTPRCWRGYTACWEIRNDRLYLQSLHHGKDDSPIPLSIVFKGNKEKPVKATWFTGKLFLPYGEELEKWGSRKRNVSRDSFSRFSSIYEKEILCDVERGSVVSKTVYDNYIRKGDRESLAKCEQEIIDYDWDNFPELEGKKMCCDYTVYPRVDGMVDSIRIEVSIRGVGQKFAEITERITDPDHPHVRICRGALEKVTKWEVAFFRGEIQPVRGAVTDGRRESGLRLEKCDLKNFMVVDPHGHMMKNGVEVLVKPENQDPIALSLNSKIERLCLKKNSFESLKAFQVWQKEIVNNCIPVEVREMIREKKGGGDVYAWPRFKVNLFVDRTGKIHSVHFLMADNVYMALTEPQIQSMHDAFMREDLTAIVPLLDFGGLTWNDEYKNIGYGRLEFSVVR